MARLIIWSPRAADDLEAICESIAQESEHYARVFAAKPIRLVEHIAKFPGAGRVVPEYVGENLRERVFQSYRIIYRVKPDVVEIVAIVHAGRMLKDI